MLGLHTAPLTLHGNEPVCVRRMMVEASASRSEHPQHVEQASGPAAEKGQECGEHRYDHLYHNLPETIFHTLCSLK